MSRFAEKAPRQWSELISAWEAMVCALCAALGLPTRTRDTEVSTLHIETWRWMLTLPPCGEARKAAFTCGHAALLIERCRDAGPSQENDRAQFMRGHRAEELLRRCRWHIDDAKIEASSPTRRPGMPPHVRVYAYSQAVDPEHGGVNFCGVMNDSDRRRVTLAMLDDFVRHASERKTLKPSDDALIALAPALVDTLGASLPQGPWIVTSQDVWRFLAELLLEET